MNRRLRHHPARTVWLISLIVFLLSCNLLNRPPGLQATISAVNAQQTRLAQTAAAIVPLGSPGPPAQPALQPTPTAFPATSSPTPPETVSTAVTLPDLTEERLLKSARILLFEDMSASRQIRLVKEALDEAGYFYLDVGSAKGWFKTQLLSGVEWDLVIAAAEAEREFGGEFFEYIDAHLERGAGAIIENWDLDAAPEGRARPLLERCGVAVQGDWFEPDLRIFYWTAPAHPVFNQPYQLAGGLRSAAPLWRGDVGDLLQIDRASSGASAGEPAILASVNPTWTRDHGLLVTCLGGRLILQTFRSHEYHHDDMVALWQNYIYQALSHHFAYTQASLPTPAATYLPVTPPPAGPQAGPTPGPDYTFLHPCGEALTARLFEAPRTQKDLFEHHAQGTFMILRLELENQSPYPVQVWDQDYTLHGWVGDRLVTYQPHAAATGYLYIDRPSNLIQGLIQPGETWRTSLAFDIDPGGEAWELVIRPGSEFSQQVCQASLPVDR